MIYWIKWQTRDPPAGSFHRGKFRDRGRKRSDKGHSRKCGGGGESLPGSQKDWGEGPGVLFP